MLQLDHIALGTLEFGAFESWLRLDSATFESGQAHLVLLEDGTPEILGLIPQMDTNQEGPTDAPSAAEIDLPFEFQIESVQLRDFRLVVEDQSLPEPARLHAAIHSLELRDLSDRLDQPIPFDVAGSLATSGSLSATGAITPLPLLTDIEFEVGELPFTEFNPWLAQFIDIDIEITSGTGFTRGRIQAEQRTDVQSLQVFFAGESGIDNFGIQHQGQELAGLDSLRVTGINFNLAEPSVWVENLMIQSPIAEVQRDRDGQLNWITLIPQNEPSEPADPAQAVAMDPDAIPFEWSLGQLEIRDGQVGFSDASVSPTYSTRMENMQLLLKDVSSDPASRSELHFSGRFSDAGNVEMEGLTNANPMDPYADLQVQLTGFGLPATSGYTGQFVGRAIAQGRLDLTTEATLADENLSASNAVLIRNLSLGERIDHPDAMSLPLDLAVSLLRNRRGEISLNIPLSGSMDDPQFSIAAVASQAFSSVIGSIVTSPFSILGSLVGAPAEELSQVVFEPGSSVLRDDQRETIAELADALYERPALTLEILAYSDRNTDRQALAQSSLRDDLRGHYEELHGEPPTDSADYWNDKSLVLSFYEQTFGPLEAEEDASSETSTSPSREPRADSGTQASTQDSEDRNLFGRFFSWLGGGRDTEDTETQPAREIPPEPEPVAEASPDNAEIQTNQPDISSLRTHLLDNIEISDDALMRLGRDRADTVQSALLSNQNIQAERVQIGTVQLNDTAKVEFDVR